MNIQYQPEDVSYSNNSDIHTDCAVVAGHYCKGMKILILLLLTIPPRIIPLLLLVQHSHLS